MKKVFLSAGHSSTRGKNSQGKFIDNGAAGNGYVEGVEAAVLRALIVEELKPLGIVPITDKDDSILSETITEFKNKVDENSIVIDIHFNAATPKATGTEVLIPGSPDAKERALAEDLAHAISNCIGIPLRGRKGVITELESARGKLGWMRLPGINNLIEVCFISNFNDMTKYEKNKNALAKVIAQTIHKHAADGSGGLECTYTVVKGDTLSKIAAKHNTTVQKIMEKNNLKQANLIEIGQKLKL